MEVNRDAGATGGAGKSSCSRTMGFGARKSERRERGSGEGRDKAAQEGEMGSSMPPGSMRAYKVAAHWRERGRGEMGIGLGLRGERAWALEAGPEEKGLRLDPGWALSLSDTLFS